MDKKRFVILFVVSVILAVLIVLAVRLRDGGRTQDDQIDGGIVGGEVVPMETCGIPPEAFRSGSRSYKGVDGIKTLFPSGYVRGTPLVEMRFLRRKPDGETEAFVLNTVGLSKRQGYGPDFALQEAHGIRLAVTSNPKESRGLRPGNVYTISHYWAPGQSNATLTPKPRPGFRVPDNLPANTVYRVKLIIKDEIRERELLAKKLAAKERQKRIAEEEKITVTFTTVPDSHFVVLYNDGDRSREGSPAEPGGDVVVMKGPNKLEGELGVFLAKSGGRCWAYIRSLKKRSITLPKDADIVVSEDKLVELPISFDKVDLLKLSKYKAIAFYGSADGKLPLFGSSLRQLASQDPNAPKELSVKILPGTYYVRVGTPREDESPIGTVTIKGRDPDPFSIELPD